VGMMYYYYFLEIQRNQAKMSKTKSNRYKKRASKIRSGVSKILNPTRPKHIRKIQRRKEPPMKTQRRTRRPLEPPRFACNFRPLRWFVHGLGKSVQYRYHIQLYHHHGFPCCSSKHRKGCCPQGMFQ
jgi:hypothetical protein